jgi:hypothetical protein
MRLVRKGSQFPRGPKLEGFMVILNLTFFYLYARIGKLEAWAESVKQGGNQALRRSGRTVRSRAEIAAAQLSVAGPSSAAVTPSARSLSLPGPSSGAQKKRTKTPSKAARTAAYADTTKPRLLVDGTLREIKGNFSVLSRTRQIRLI